MFCIIGTPFHAFRSNSSPAVNSAEQLSVSGHEGLLESTNRNRWDHRQWGLTSHWWPGILRRGRLLLCGGQTEGADQGQGLPGGWPFTLSVFGLCLVSHNMTLQFWQHDVLSVLMLQVPTLSLILSGGTGGTGGDPAQSPWHRRRGGSRRPWRQGGRGTKGLRCPQKTWYLRGRRQEFRGGESLGAQAAEGRCAVPHQHPQKPFWQDPTTATVRLTVNVASVTHNSRSRPKCLRLFRLLHSTYDQCAVCLWVKQKCLKLRHFPQFRHNKGHPIWRYTQCKKPGVQVAHWLEIVWGRN